MAGKLANELRHHLRADVLPAIVGMNGQIENVQSIAMQFVNDMADHAIAQLSYHADAVALPQAMQKVFLGPRNSEAFLFRLQDFLHISSNHPANVDACLSLNIAHGHGTSISLSPSQVPT